MNSPGEGKEREQGLDLLRVAGKDNQSGKRIKNLNS